MYVVETTTYDNVYFPPISAFKSYLVCNICLNILLCIIIFSKLPTSIYRFFTTFYFWFLLLLTWISTSRRYTLHVRIISLSKPHIAVDDNLNAEVDFYIFSHTFHFYLSIAIWPCWLCIVFNTYDIYKIS